jgi:arsenite methyltransferase
MDEKANAALREQVRSRYAGAARAILAPAAAPASACCGIAAAGDCEPPESPAAPEGSGSPGPARACCGSEAAAPDGRGTTSTSTADGPGSLCGDLYPAGETGWLPQDAVRASLGCGNPVAVADLHEGERVLDLGSGGGIDVLLSARRVGAPGFVYGVDMTDEMLTLARANAAKAGVTNVEFRKGEIEALPLPDAAVDVVISNCVINLSVDKRAVLREMFRVLVPGGRIGISDVVAEDHMSPADRAAAGSYVGCIAGALTRAEYLDGLAAAGFGGASVTFTAEAAPGMHTAIIRASKPRGA